MQLRCRSSSERRKWRPLFVCSSLCCCCWIIHHNLVRAHLKCFILSPGSTACLCLSFLSASRLSLRAALAYLTCRCCVYTLLTYLVVCFLIFVYFYQISSLTSQYITIFAPENQKVKYDNLISEMYTRLTFIQRNLILFTFHRNLILLSRNVFSSKKCCF